MQVISWAQSVELKKISPTITLSQDSTDSCFHILTLPLEIETHKTRQLFSSLLLINVGEPV